MRSPSLRKPGRGGLGPRQPLTRFLLRRQLMTSCMRISGRKECGRNVATVKEIRRKASKIAPAYNKGALQYLPDES